MSLLQRFIDYIKEKDLFHSKDYLLIAVSGGVDSAVLCELCYQAGYDFAIAHCNFQLRDEESERDEQLVRSISEKYKADFFVKKFDTQSYAEEHKISIQVAARQLRYHWFNELLESIESKGPAVHQSAYVLTAHHADDNIETVMMNFFKGTGIKGLHGIAPKQNKIVRPLLFAKKDELLLFAKENNIFYAEDSSNITDKYTRNYFRNQLIPSLQKIYPDVKDNIKNNIERFKDVETLYNQAILFHKKKLLEYKDNEVHIPVLKLQKSEPLHTIVYEIIIEYGFTAHKTGDVINLLKSESGKSVSSATYNIIRNRKWLIITPKINNKAAHIVIQQNDKKMEFENGWLSIKKYSSETLKHATVATSATLDKKNIHFPLLLRKWKKGDYFYPLGMQKKKKLSRFFIDQKISISDKEKIWVIESNKKILWVIGLRIDDRFKLTNQTKDILQIDFKAL